MVSLGFEPGAAGWKVRTNPLSYGGTPVCSFFDLQSLTWTAVNQNLLARKEVIYYWQKLLFLEGANRWNNHTRHKA